MPNCSLLQSCDDIADEHYVWQKWTFSATEKEEMEGTVKDCFTELSSLVPSFLNHTFVEW